MRDYTKLRAFELDKSLNNIRQYIRTHPAAWDKDIENPDKIVNIELNKSMSND